MDKEEKKKIHLTNPQSEILVECFTEKIKEFKSQHKSYIDKNKIDFDSLYFYTTNEFGNMLAYDFKYGFNKLSADFQLEMRNYFELSAKNCCDLGNTK